ncbi:hypothetical protein BLNAU_1649 [Blattamonas nauphoetae]|uniref:COPI associated protein n=1 Tax=Blattamonas nauphoetae TaxID=2049346 RepID=A0ABQ9YH80_9EUKA|nr:hypothetical protein BLNAU_1649 [Blattamonas nauphoetae]
MESQGYEQATFTANPLAQPAPTQATITAQQEKKSCSDSCRACRNCYTGKPMKAIVTISMIVIQIVLIGMNGVFCPIMLFTHLKGFVIFPRLLFCIYTVILSLALILVEFRLRILYRVFPFLMSPTFRGFLTFFLGTLSMACWEVFAKWSWVGYVIGGVTLLISFMYLLMCCCDRNWKKQQKSKYVTQPVAQPAPAQPQYQPADNYAPAQNPLSTNSTAGVVGAVAATPEGQNLARTAGSAAVSSVRSSGNTDNVYGDIASNPQVQQAAVNTAVAAAQNPAVQSAASKAAHSAADYAMQTAYDRLFDD